MRALSAAGAMNTIKTPCRQKWCRAGFAVALFGIYFTNAYSLRQPRFVRRSFAICILWAAAVCCVRGQDQERKLMDRLLKPDMTLQNEAQNKKFIGDGSASINQRATVGSFYAQQN